MGSDNFWLQPNNRRFSLEASKEGINIDDASSRLNISKNQLSSIFTQADANQNGVLETTEEGVNELAQFLNAINAKFTQITGRWGDNSKEVAYEDARGNSVLEEYDDEGHLVRKVITNPVVVPLAAKTIEYKFKNGFLTEQVEKEGDSEKRTTFEYTMDKLSKTVTTEGNKETTKFYLNGKETEAIVTQDGKTIEKSFKNSNGDMVHVFLDGENIVENITTKDNKNTVTVYKGDFEGYESGKLNKIYERVMTISFAAEGENIIPQVSAQEVEYDGKGNTIVYAAAGDGWEKLAKRFGVSEKDLKRLNPKTAKTDNIQAAQAIVVPGMISPDSSTLNGRRVTDRAKALQEASKAEFDKAAENIYSSAVNEEVLTQDFNNVYDYARYLTVTSLMLRPEEPTYAATVNTLANELIMLNGNKFQYKKGSKVKLIVSRTQKVEQSLLEVYGLKPNEENAVFYARYARLSNKERSEVLDALEYCRKNNITDKAKMNKEIQRLCRGLNLFDTDIKKLTHPSDIQIRKVMAQSMLQQLMQIAALYESANPRKDSFWDCNPFELAGAGFMEVYSAVKRGLDNAHIFLNIPDADTGTDIAKDLRQKIDMCIKLIGICDREEAYQRQSIDYKIENGTNQFKSEFERTYKIITGGKTIDYDGVANYLQLSAEMSKMMPKQRTDVDGVTGAAIPVDAEKYKELEEELKKYSDQINIPISGDFENRIQKWTQNYQQIGGLADMASTLALMYVTGGFSAIGRGSAAVGSYLARGTTMSMERLTAGTIGRTILSKEAQSVVTNVVANAVNVQGQLITNSALTATAFNISRFCQSASDFHIDEQEWTQMAESWKGLAEFTYVNGLFIGPATQFLAKSITGLAHTERAAHTILNNALGKPNTFGAVMTALLENAANIEKGIQIPLSFAMNMEYMAKADNMTYGEAFSSLLQMEGVSKMMAAIMGQKGIKLPPEKVKTVTARVNEYKVDIARFARDVDGGRKDELLIRVTSPEGEVVGEFKDFEAFQTGMKEIVEREAEVFQKTEQNITEAGENPAQAAAEKVKKQWLETDLEAPAGEETVDLFNLDQEAGLKETHVAVENEVTSLVLHGQLEETLAMRYDALADVLARFAKNHSIEITKLYESCNGDTELFANEFLRMLSKEYGDSEYRPEIKIIADSSLGGAFDFVKNLIKVNGKQSLSELCNSIVHEYTHALQFLEVITQKGEQGIRDMINNDPRLTDAQKTNFINQTLNNKYYQYLMSRPVAEKPAGSLDDYLARV